MKKQSGLFRSLQHPVKLYILWLTTVSCIYLTSCPLLFDNRIYTIIINHIPYIALFFVDCFIIYKNKKIFQVYKLYIKNSKWLFLAMFLFIAYDIFTLSYAKTLSYSYMKYIVFIKIIFLCLSIFLCLYEDEYGAFQNNLRFYIQSIGFILILIIVTTFVEWHLGLAPYLKRISLIEDYNVYATYMLFTLHFFMYSYLKNRKFFSVVTKIIYISVGILSLGLLYLTGSRRAVVLVPIVFFVFCVAYVIEEIKQYCLQRTKVQKKKYIGVFILLIFSILWMRQSVPLFEKYIQMIEENNMYVEQTNVWHTRGGDLSSRYETINVDEGFSSREDLWDIANEEIKNFSFKEFVFGKGNGYAYNIYENTDNPKVWNLLKAGGHTEMKPHWTHPHNLILTEILEGGIIKIILLLFLMFILIIYVIQLIIRKHVLGFMMLSIYLCFAGELFLGSTYGLLGEDLFWLTTAILICLRLETMGAEKNAELSKCN